MKKTVLVVDDEADVRESLREFLELFGYEVSTAIDGQDAVSVLSSSLVPNIVLLDLMMPNMTGQEFMKRRQLLSMSEVPVVVISADRLTEQKTFEMGADGYLLKPIDLDSLLDLIERLTSQPRITG